MAWMHWIFACLAFLSPIYLDSASQCLSQNVWVTLYEFQTRAFSMSFRVWNLFCNSVNPVKHHVPNARAETLYLEAVWTGVLQTYFHKPFSTGLEMQNLAMHCSNLLICHIYGWQNQTIEQYPPPPPPLLIFFILFTSVDGPNHMAWPSGQTYIKSNSHYLCLGFKFDSKPISNCIVLASNLNNQIFTNIHKRGLSSPR